MCIQVSKIDNRLCQMLWSNIAVGDKVVCVRDGKYTADGGLVAIAKHYLKAGKEYTILNKRSNGNCESGSVEVRCNDGNCESGSVDVRCNDGQERHFCMIRFRRAK